MGRIGVFYTQDYICYSNGDVYNIKTNKFLKGDYTKKGGYPQVGLNIDGKFKKRRRHRMVAECYLEPVPGKDQVNHIDGNKLNSSIENLEWVSCQENIDHYHRELKNHKEYKLNVFDVLYIKEFLRAGRKFKEIEKAFGICKATIHEIKYNKCCKTHLRALGYIQ